MPLYRRSTNCRRGDPNSSPRALAPFLFLEPISSPRAECGLVMARAEATPRWPVYLATTQTASPVAPLSRRDCLASDWFSQLLRGEPSRAVPAQGVRVRAVLFRRF